jgi:hypothetical protein
MVNIDLNPFGDDRFAAMSIDQQVAGEHFRLWVLGFRL